VFAEAGFLAATFNCRGAGRSGGHGNASAQTEVADYESVLDRLMSYAENAAISVDALYICVSPFVFVQLTTRDTVRPPLSLKLMLAYGSFIASLVPPPSTNTNYILISPLLAPIANLTTFFRTSTQKGILSKHSAETYSGSVQHILSIYGCGDIFAFTTGRYRRYFDHVRRNWGDKVQIEEVDGGGHFWLDARSRKSLLEKVQAFIQV
jgi:alpha/beta superfamily hydrolase